MKSFMLLSFALVAMAAANDRVSVVNNPNGVKVVDNSGVLDNPLKDTILNNPDPGFYKPTTGVHRPVGGFQKPDISPAFVQPRPPPPHYQPQPPQPYHRPGKQYDNPYLRGGK